MNKKIIIHICSKDRATEIGLLLQSLRTQTFKDFNILILDDGSNVPLMNFYFIQYLIQRMKIEGHNIKIIRNNISSGVSGARQQLVDYSMEHGKEELICRLDDDVIIEPEYLEKLIEVIDKGYDIASGITTPFVGPDIKRDTKFVDPIIGYCELNDKGELTFNGDDCGYGYTEDKILLSPHFRSSALYKKKIHIAGVDYKSRLSKHGFREEQIFSFKAILKGFKIGVRTGANALHLMTPSGGERSTTNMTQFNQDIFEETVKKMFEEHGDFLSKYYKDNNVEPKKLNEDEYIKSTNLVSKK
ncbi:glycosyltransferase family 2 protein [Candidatus Pacearchaeota archaeon]|nr:glycosyltransferase family 2 protein [Candidatus Pacearchaeota archaeon]